jgi:hypothetical protein
MAVADEHLAPVLPGGGLPAGLATYAAACCAFDPYERPDTSMLVPELEEAVRQLQVTAPLCVCGVGVLCVFGGRTTAGCWL